MMKGARALLAAVALMAATAVPAPADTEVEQVLGQLLKLKVGGYIRLMYYRDNADDPQNVYANDYFSVRNARVKLEVTHSEYVAAVFMLDAVSGSTTQPSLIDAYLQWTPTTWFGLRMGQYKVPFGREMLRSVPKLLVYDRGAANKVLGGWKYLNRDIGAMASFSPPSRVKPTLQFGLFNGSGRNATDPDDHKDFVVRALLSPLPFLEVGANYRMKKLGYPAVLDSLDNIVAQSSSETFSAFGADFLLKRGAFEVEGEFLQADAPTVPDVSARDIMLAARFCRRLDARLFDSWEIGAKLELWDPDTDQNDDAETFLVFGPAVSFASGSRLQLNVELQSFQQEDPDSITRGIAMWTVLL
jgi:hypothetical protein